MSLNVSDSGGGNFELVPEGVYIGRCFKIIDIGTQWIEFKGESKEQKKLLIMWELLDDTVRMKDGKPFAITKQYTASLSEKANLRADLEAWRGKKFTPAELESFDLKNVLGAYCQLQVVHSEDGKYANVNSIMASKQKPEGVNPLVSFDIDEPDMKVFETFSDKLKAKIQAAPEFRMATSTPDTSSDSDYSQDINKVKAAGEGHKIATAPPQKDDVVIEDISDEPINLDDIPF